MGNSAAILPVVLAALSGVAACATPKATVNTAEGTPTEGAAPALDANPARSAAAAGSPTPALSSAEAQGEAAAPSAEPSASVAAAPPSIPRGTAVLHVGDSFAVSGFSKALRPRMEALGARYEVRAETSSFTTTWASKMEKVVADTQPDLVIINLGANEVSNTDPATHAPHVRKIVRAIGGRPCVWVSTPLWRKDTGINEVIRENSAPCRFFDTDTLVTTPIPRQSDHIHPTEAGGALWANSFWVWLFEQRASADGGASSPQAPSSKGMGGESPAAVSPSGSAAKVKVNPWRLKPAPPEEHRPHGSDERDARAH